MSQATIGIQGVGPADIDSGMRRRAIISCALGNFVELYDFLIFGLFAAQIGANFFPASNPTTPLLSAFATYGVGFLMRPVGAIVIGAYGDRRGRKAALVLTVGMMAGATALTGLIPSYASIGIAGPILLILCRLVQGFSTGGEWGGAAAFLVEYAQPGKRGITGSWHQFAVGLALTSGLLTAALLNSMLDKETMLAWGWRLPFILGFVLAPVGLYVRSRVSESPAFERTKQQQGVARNPFADALTTQRLPVLAAFGLAAVGTVGNYTFNIYMPTYATKQLGLVPGTAFWSGTLAAVMLTVLTPLFGALSDKVGQPGDGAGVWDLEAGAEIVPEGDTELGAGLEQREEGIARLLAGLGPGLAGDLAFGDAATDVALGSVGVQRDLRARQDEEQLVLVGAEARHRVVEVGEAGDAAEHPLEALA